LFYFDGETAWAACVLRRTTNKKIRVTWLEDFLTSKWPGSFTALAPPLTVTVTEALVLRPLLEDQGRITESIRILVSVDRMFSDHDETSLSIAAVSAQSVAGSMLAVQQQKRLCPSVANSSTCPRHDDVATRWSAQCRSTWNIGNRCQVWDIFRRVSQKQHVNQQAQLVLDPLSDWQPVQLSHASWSHTVTRL